MHEEIEYAQMLEIPVSTVSVSEKHRKFRKHKGDLKQSLINKVNAASDAALPVDKGLPKKRAPKTQRPENAAPQVSDYQAADYQTPDSQTSDYQMPTDVSHDIADAVSPDFISTLPCEEDCYSSCSTVTVENAEAQEGFPGQETQVDLEKRNARGANGYAKRSLSSAFLTAEFAAACLLCGTIFMTNIFMPKSGMNVFFRSLATSSQKSQETAKKYSDFTLQSVVNEWADVTLNVSESGVLSFCGKCCVYPAVDGEIVSVTQNENGTYDVKISHSDDFYGVLSNLDTVYYVEGDNVYANIPVGYTNGNSDVQVTMYSGGELITSFVVDEENCLAWAQP